MINKQKINIYRNTVRRLVDNLHIKRNVVYFNSHNSVEHEMVKARICYELQKEKKEYLTEAQFYSKAITDILVLDRAMCIEITISETEKQLKKKIEKFPKSLGVISVKSADEYILGNYKILR